MTSDKTSKAVLEFHVNVTLCVQRYPVGLKQESNRKYLEEIRVTCVFAMPSQVVAHASCESRDCGFAP